MRRYELMEDEKGEVWFIITQKSLPVKRRRTKKKKEKRVAFRSISNTTLHRCRVSLWGGSSAQSVWIINSELPSAPSCFLSGHTVNPNSNWKADVGQMWKLHLHQSTCVLSLTCDRFSSATWTTLPRRFHKHAHLSGHILQVTIFIIPRGHA